MKFLFVLISLLGLIATPFFYMDHPSFSWQWAWLGLYIVFQILVFRKFERIFSDLSVMRGAISLVFAGAWVYSSHVHAFSSLGPVMWLVTFLAFLMFALIFYCLIYWLEQPFTLNSPRPEWWQGLIYGLVPALVWSIYLAAYFPGKMSYDSFWQWDMAHRIMPYNAWHPVLHTWFIQATAWLFNSPAAYSSVQIILVSAVIGYALYNLQSFGVPAIWVVLIDLLYALDPINGFYSITMWKDIPFASFILLLTVLFVKIILSKGEWLKWPSHMVALTFTAFIAMNLRDNGVEVVLASFVLFIVFVNKARKRMTLVLIPVAILYFLFNGPLMNAFHVIRNPLDQALAIPSQQIAATYKAHGRFTPALETYFDQILPRKDWIKDYKPHTVNPIKHDPKYDAAVIDKSFTTYLRNWAELLVLNPTTFVRAYLKQVAEIWQFHSPRKISPYFDSSLDLQDYSLGLKLNAPPKDWADPKPLLMKKAYQHYVNQTRMASPKLPVMTFSQYQKAAKETVTPLKTRSLLPGVKAFFNKLFYLLQSRGIKNYLLKGAIPLFLLAMSLTAAIRRRGLKAAGFFLPVCFVIITIAMAMPAQDYRYVYSFIFSVPFLFLLGKLGVD